MMQDVTKQNTGHELVQKLGFVRKNVGGFRDKPRGDWFSFAGSHETSIFSPELALRPELGRLLTNCNSLQIPNYMTKIVLSNVIHYIKDFRQYNQTIFKFILDTFDLVSHIKTRFKI